MCGVSDEIGSDIITFALNPGIPLSIGTRKTLANKRKNNDPKKGLPERKTSPTVSGIILRCQVVEISILSSFTEFTEVPPKLKGIQPEHGMKELLYKRESPCEQKKRA